MMPFSASASSSASGRLDSTGNSWTMGGGDWIVNLGGSGTTQQTASATDAAIPWLWIAVAMGAAWFLKK